MGTRHILHCDMNCFYASVEMQRHPELRDKPLAVCGSQEERHGIVLTANYIAKPYGVRTGMAIWQAKQRCPHLVILPPDMGEYIRICVPAENTVLCSESNTKENEQAANNHSCKNHTGKQFCYDLPIFPVTGCQYERVHFCAVLA